MTITTTGVRRYCGRVGVVLVADADGRCPECGSAQHQAVEPQTACGWFVACGEADHGHPCELDAGHAGPHRARECRP